MTAVSAGSKEGADEQQKQSNELENLEAFEASAFEALERDFKEVMAELLDDESLQEFRKQYERLHDALRQSHDTEKMLIGKCRELNAQIVENAYKVQRALKQSQEDQSTITALKKEIDKAWKIVEGSHDKEQTLMATVEDMRAEVARLSKLVEQSAEVATEQETQVKILTQKQTDLTKHRDLLAAQRDQLQAQSQELKEARETLTADYEKTTQDLARAEAILEERTAKLTENVSKREKLDEELKQKRGTLDTISKDSVETLNQIAEAQEEHRQALRELKAATKDVEHQTTIQGSLQEEINRIRQQSALEGRKTQKLKKDIKALQVESEKHKKELAKATKAKEESEATYEKLRAEKEEAERERAGLLEEKKNASKRVKELTERVEKISKRQEIDAKMLSDLSHERELLQKALQKATDRKDIEVALVKEQEQKSNSLFRELVQWRHAKAQSEEQLQDLVVERDRFMQQLKEVNDRYVGVLQRIREKDTRLAGMKEEIAAIRAEFIQQKNLCEAVKADRNLYAKNMLESQSEISEIKRKFASLEHRIKQLRGEVEDKDQELVRKHFATQELAKTLEQLKGSQEKAKKRLRNLDSVAEVYRKEILKLEKALKEAEEEKDKQEKDCNKVASEKELLSTRLTKKKEEQADVHEQIRLCESSLRKGEARYRELTDNIKEKESQLRKLQAELAGLQARVGNMDEYKHEAYQLHQQLLAEQAKVKALGEELENPMNIHRWRRLEGSDPETLHMLEKMRNLQRRLISSVDEAVQKKEAVKRVEQEIKELERKLARIPGPELREQLAVHGDTLKERNDQLAAMNAELADYRRIIDEHQAEVRRLKKEKQEVMQKYNQHKKQQQASQNAAKSKDKQPSTSGQGKVKAKHNPSMPRYTGGGFCLTSSS